MQSASLGVRGFKMHALKALITEAGMPSAVFSTTEREDKPENSSCPASNLKTQESLLYLRFLGQLQTENTKWEIPEIKKICKWEIAHCSGLHAETSHHSAQDETHPLAQRVHAAHAARPSGTEQPAQSPYQVFVSAALMLDAPYFINNVTFT